MSRETCRFRCRGDRKIHPICHSIKVPPTCYWLLFSSNIPKHCCGHFARQLDIIKNCSIREGCYCISEVSTRRVTNLNEIAFSRTAMQKLENFTGSEQWSPSSWYRRIKQSPQSINASTPVTMTTSTADRHSICCCDKLTSITSGANEIFDTTVANGFAEPTTNC